MAKSNKSIVLEEVWWERIDEYKESNKLKSRSLAVEWILVEWFKSDVILSEILNKVNQLPESNYVPVTFEQEFVEVEEHKDLPLPNQDEMDLEQLFSGF